MNLILETERFILKEINIEHADDLFEMDANPAVHQFIENKPLKTKKEIYPIIEMIRAQYTKFGVGRWAVIQKTNKECVGWAGIKFYAEPIHTYLNFYDLGYRFKQKYWGKGFATETSKQIVHYAFHTLKLNQLNAHADEQNIKSNKVLLKCNFELKDNFLLDGKNINWYELSKSKPGK
ncbi:MAG: GNAT family N-acetyltransferase [Sphingobacteriaceae bacterium]|nr:GNAT family N-acetyltransferase [Sphingobacteriaceae bacterium]